MDEKVAIEHTVTIDEAMPRRMSAAFFWFAALRPLQLTLLVLLALVGFLLFGVITPSDDLQPLVKLSFGLLGSVASVGLALLLLRRNVRRRISVMCVVGGRYGVGLGEGAIALEAPLSNGEVSYQAFESVHVVGEFVLLKYQRARLYAALPAVLFPGDALDRVRDRIAAANVH